MDWYWLMLILLGGLMLLLCIGVPVAFAFTFINIIGAYVFMGGEPALGQIVLSIYDSVTKFALLTIAMFIIMGEVMFHSGMGIRMMDIIDKMLGRLPGRLGIISVAAGTLFAAMSGSSIGSTALLGTILVPEMEKRGYQRSMSLGPIMGSGGLAIMIPPSGFAVMLAILGNIPLGKLLLAIVVPGLIMAAFYAAYIIIRCFVQPSLAPAYTVDPLPLTQKLILFLKYVLPMVSIIIVALGLIFLGVATPSESASLGALFTFILAMIYQKLSWEVVKKSVHGTTKITAMVLMIVTGSAAFSQIMAFTGASKGLVDFTMRLPFASPIVVFILMLIITTILGCFMEVNSIMMITTPIFMPLVNKLGIDSVWWGATMLLTYEMAQMTPPFGMILFTMKGIAPRDVTMGEVIRAAMPFLYMDVLVVALMLWLPIIPLWLPSIM
jgi:tripartite ATP-independent transporter DctM subunit